MEKIERLELAPGWGYKKDGSRYIEVYDPFGITGYKNKRVLDRQLKRLNDSLNEEGKNGKE